MVRAFREADKLRQKRQNTAAWLQGAYVYDAIGRLVPVLRAFSKKSRPEPYLKVPYGEKESPEVTPEEELQAKQMKARLFFESWASATKKQMNK